jgi:hypothetical protein
VEVTIVKKAVLASLLLVVSVTFTGCGGEMTAQDHSTHQQHMGH